MPIYYNGQSYHPITYGHPNSERKTDYILGTAVATDHFVYPVPPQQSYRSDKNKYVNYQTITYFGNDDYARLQGGQYGETEYNGSMVANTPGHGTKSILLGISDWKKYQTVTFGGNKEDIVPVHMNNTYTNHKLFYYRINTNKTNYNYFIEKILWFKTNRKIYDFKDSDNTDAIKIQNIGLTECIFNDTKIDNLDNNQRIYTNGIEGNHTLYGKKIGDWWYYILKVDSIQLNSNMFKDSKSTAGPANSGSGDEYNYVYINSLSFDIGETTGMTKPNIPEIHFIKETLNVTMVK